jgi:hypothetical protein
VDVLDAFLELNRRAPGLSHGAQLTWLYCLAELRRSGRLLDRFDLAALLDVHPLTTYRYINELVAAGEIEKGATTYWRDVPIEDRVAEVFPRLALVA